MIVQKGLVALVCTLIVGIAQASPRMDNLRCEYLHKPFGVDASHPRLSWEISSSELGPRPSAYQILVASNQEVPDQSRGDRWDSAKVLSDQSDQVGYNAKPLHAHEECYWKVRRWDKDGDPTRWSVPARWTVGLQGAKERKANWIGVRNPDRNADNLATPAYLRKQFVVNSQQVRKAITTGSEKPVSQKDFMACLAFPHCMSSIQVAKLQGRSSGRVRSKIWLALLASLG